MATEAKPKALRLFGLNVRQAREARKLTQEKLGERAELDPTYISGIERGCRNASLLSLVRLADGLNVGLWELVENIGREA